MRILMFGTFDGLHKGHRSILDSAVQRAEKEAGELHVVLARDANVEKIKKHKPIHAEEDRMKAITNAYPSAHVHLGDDHDFTAPITIIQPDLILLGYDQHLPPGMTDADLPCAVERLPAFEPEKYKSSLLRK